MRALELALERWMEGSRRIAMWLVLMGGVSGCAQDTPICVDASPFPVCEGSEFDDGGEPTIAVVAVCDGDEWRFRCSADGLERVVTENPRCQIGGGSRCSAALGEPTCVTVPCDGEWHSNPAFGP